LARPRFLPFKINPAPFFTLLICCVMGILTHGLWLPDYDILDAMEKDVALLALTYQA
jgi:hypothetical protein